MNEGRFHGTLKHWDFILIDLLCLQGGFLLSYRILRGNWKAYSSQAYLLQGVMISICQLLVILFFDQYHGILRRKRFDEFLAVCKMIGETFLLEITILFILHNTQIFSRLQTGLTALVYIVIDYLLRQANKRRVKNFHKDEALKKSLVLITSEALVDEAWENLYRSDVWRDFRVSHVVLLDKTAGKPSLWNGVPVLPMNEESIRTLSHTWVDEVFLLQPDNMPYAADILATFMDMGITVSSALEARTKEKWQRREVRKLGSYQVLTNSIRFITPGERIIKRGFDIIGGLIGCFFTGILTLILGPLIKMADPGPIFFGQTRIGQNGRQFTCWKFRSMYMDAEDRKAELLAKNRVKDGMMFKIYDDPRIIGSAKKKKDGRPGGIGNFIRNTSLDEFPQFYNVLKGEMSIVGWRPCTLDEWEKYELKHRIRAAMKPGITGMWQVSGRAEITDFEEVVRLDRKYIENWSLALDLKILLKTVVAVVGRNGAA